MVEARKCDDEVVMWVELQVVEEDRDMVMTKM